MAGQRNKPTSGYPVIDEYELAKKHGFTIIEAEDVPNTAYLSHGKREIHIESHLSDYKKRIYLIHEMQHSGSKDFLVSADDRQSLSKKNIPISKEESYPYLQLRAEYIYKTTLENPDSDLPRSEYLSLLANRHLPTHILVHYGLIEIGTWDATSAFYKLCYVRCQHRIYDLSILFCLEQMKSLSVSILESLKTAVDNDTASETPDRLDEIVEINSGLIESFSVVSKTIHDEYERHLDLCNNMYGTDLD